MFPEAIIWLIVALVAFFVLMEYYIIKRNMKLFASYPFRNFEFRFLNNNGEITVKYNGSSLTTKNHEKITQFIYAKLAEYLDFNSNYKLLETLKRLNYDKVGSIIIVQRKDGSVDIERVLMHAR